MLAGSIRCRGGTGTHRLTAACAVAVALTLVRPAAAGDFVSLCEANQVYDTGKPTSDAERRICRCIRDRFGPRQEGAAIEVFQKVLAARQNGSGLHPSQVDLGELVALMSFADSLQACTRDIEAAHRGS